MPQPVFPVRYTRAGCLSWQSRLESQATSPSSSSYPLPPSAKAHVATLEWRSALEAERRSGVDRVLIVKWTKDALVPADMSGNRQYTMGPNINQLVTFLVSGNTAPALRTSYLEPRPAE